MKPLDCESNLAIVGDECAALVMDVIPQVMRTVRGTMRKFRPAELTETQFRTLFILRRHTGASLSVVADHLVLTLPSASKLVDGLVKRGFVRHEMSLEDRRRASLMLTELGQETLDIAYREAMSRVVTVLDGLNEEEHLIVSHGLRALQRVFAASRLEFDEAGENHEYRRSA